MLNDKLLIKKWKKGGQGNVTIKKKLGRKKAHDFETFAFFLQVLKNSMLQKETKKTTSDGWFFIGIKVWKTDLKNELKIIF